MQSRIFKFIWVIMSLLLSVKCCYALSKGNVEILIENPSYLSEDKSKKVYTCLVTAVTALGINRFEVTEKTRLQYKYNGKNYKNDYILIECQPTKTKTEKIYQTFSKGVKPKFLRKEKRPKKLGLGHKNWQHNGRVLKFGAIDSTLNSMNVTFPNYIIDIIQNYDDYGKCPIIKKVMLTEINNNKTFSSDEEINPGYHKKQVKKWKNNKYKSVNKSVGNTLYIKVELGRGDITIKPMRSYEKRW